MKTAILVLVLVSSSATWAQTAMGPQNQALSPPSPALSSGQPALGVAGANGQPITNVSVAEVSAQLVDLQARIEELLPILASFNNNFDFISVGTQAQQSAAPAAGNASTLLGNNFSTSLGVNLGQNLSTLVGATSPAAASPPTPTGAANGAPGFGSQVATNGFATFPVTRDSLRGLLLLQFDMQRMLPVLNGLNSGSGIAGLFPETIPSTTTSNNGTVIGP